MPFGSGFSTGFSATQIGRQVGHEVAYSGALHRPERQRTAKIHRCYADSRRHQAIDDAFAQTGGEFRGKTMAENLLRKPVTDGDRTRDGEMGDHVP